MTTNERTELQLRNQLKTMATQIALLQKHNDRLNDELPQMRKENLRLTNFLKDAAAFIRVSNSGKGAWNSNIVLSTLIHDITGLANDEPCFVPRVTGYSGKQETP
jgi:hypothetical protein